MFLFLIYLVLKFENTSNFKNIRFEIKERDFYHLDFCFKNAYSVKIITKCNFTY